MWILTVQVATSGKVVGIVSFPLGLQGEKVPLLVRERFIGRIPAQGNHHIIGPNSHTQRCWPGLLAWDRDRYLQNRLDLLIAPSPYGISRSKHPIKYLSSM
jgi:hypothetical protein